MENEPKTDEMKLSPEHELLFQKYVDQRLKRIATAFGVGNVGALVAAAVYILFVLPGQTASQAATQMSSVQKLVSIMAERSAGSLQDLNQDLESVRIDLKAAQAKITQFQEDLVLSNARLDRQETEAELLIARASELTGQIRSASLALESLKDERTLTTFHEVTAALKEKDSGKLLAEFAERTRVLEDIQKEVTVREASLATLRDAIGDINNQVEELGAFRQRNFFESNDVLYVRQPLAPTKGFEADGSKDDRHFVFQSRKGHPIHIRLYGNGKESYIKNVGKNDKAASLAIVDGHFAKD